MTDGRRDGASSEPVAFGRRKEDRRDRVVRVAAVGDFHVGEKDGGMYREAFSRVNDQADVLLLAGDLTRRGTPAEIDVVIRELLDRAEQAGEQGAAAGDEHDLTRGTMISRFSFAIDVNEWGFHDLRHEKIQAMQRHPEIVKLEASDVWDERADFNDPAQTPETVDTEE